MPRPPVEKWYNLVREPSKPIEPKTPKVLKLKQTKLKLVFEKLPHELRWNQLKQRASKRGLSFNLTPEYVKFLLDQPCHYCNRNLAIQIDRMDNENGYTIDNVTPACKPCNSTKNAYLTHDQMMIVAKALGWKHG